MKIAATLTVLAALAVPVAASGHGNVTRLKGEVGPGFTIEVKLGSKDVKTLKPGTYSIKVEDKSSMHNFHLIGPGVNKSTSVSFVGDKTWTVTLKKGTYKYVCDPHASFMKGSFTVK